MEVEKKYTIQLRENVTKLEADKTMLLKWYGKLKAKVKIKEIELNKEITHLKEDMLLEKLQSKKWHPQIDLTINNWTIFFRYPMSITKFVQPSLLGGMITTTSMRHLEINKILLDLVWIFLWFFSILSNKVVNIYLILLVGVPFGGSSRTLWMVIHWSIFC